MRQQRRREWKDRCVQRQQWSARKWRRGEEMDRQTWHGCRLSWTHAHDCMTERRRESSRQERIGCDGVMEGWGDGAMGRWVCAMEEKKVWRLVVVWE
ncbi:hypothetical protein BC939DRAFT_467939 [Gamsiella multidivaricata]|uniref:uncharacterized protein n=1 Tax=Gamsiella multidivaricata TaxID=101098 RepID=UPI002220D841|nr:uncharacterized protein BC939DRAFT_467939 [Gamsiella multidivaricata]KAI7816742.1 hypothetical protein BC939DRAFT_467939 [Gamsiella multidivaricata]